MKRPFYILDPESPGEHERSCTAIGPFRTEREALAHLKRDAIEIFEHSDERICDAVGRTYPKWASPVQIVRLHRTVQQIPAVAITCQVIPADR